MEHVNYIGVLRRFLLRRPPLRRNLLLDRSNPFETYGDAKFKASFRFSKETARDLLRDIGHLLEHDTRGCPLPITLQLLLTLRFLATGAFYAVNGDTVNVSASTVCRTIDRVLTAINSLRLRVINFPDDDELPFIKNDFAVLSRDNFPGIIGAIDCTHIRITCPNRERAVVYINRKGFYSINCQVICDAKMKIRSIVARWPGSTHDSRIFRNSTINDRLERGAIRGHLLGDSGYACKKYLLTPILNPRNAADRRYNRAHVLARNVVERTFGVWKKRFPCLAFGLRTKLQKTLKIIVATAVLHNLAVQHGELDLEGEIPNDDVPVDPPADDDTTGNRWRQLIIDNHFTR
ncbi:putative nuclease HARBI1 [Periplaneta americana]|uniref:putative nuclease HARBI1 n=1 Tax=Periplaneta americana TaxID=6978 RepID=UPI0037E89F5A